MEKLMAWVMNLYQYEEILDESTKGIQLLLKTPDGPKVRWLPKKCINITRHLKEVQIPEWLCIKTGLLEKIQTKRKNESQRRAYQ